MDGITKGNRMEELASRHLEDAGLKVIARNFRCRTGEIDVICRDGQTIVFTEVRSRTSTRFGTPLESISWHKQRRIISAARYYLTLSSQHDQPCRFDVIAIHGDGTKGGIEWIQDAFFT